MDEWTGEIYPDVLEELIRDFRKSVDRAVDACMKAGKGK